MTVATVEKKRGRNKNPKRTHPKKAELEVLNVRVSPETNDYLCREATRRHASVGVALDEIAKEHKSK